MIEIFKKKNLLTPRLICVLTIFSFVNCDLNVAEIPVEIKVINNSGSSIKLKAFESVSRSLIKEIEIANNASVSKIFLQKEDMGTIGPKDFFEGDSISIVFTENQKFIGYHCRYNIESESCNIEGNILNNSDSRWEYERNNGSILRSYTLTQEDYNDANECNDNCDF